MKKILSILILSLLILTPVIATAGPVYPNSGMSTANSKYYCVGLKYSPKNSLGNEVFVYWFRPIWRINTSNSISSTSDASTFTKSNILSQWKLIDSASAWDLYKSGSNNVEAYYGEGIAAAWGINMSGEASAKTSASGCDVTVKTTASVTVGQALTCKYRAVVSTGSDWTSCDYYGQLYK